LAILTALYDASVLYPAPLRDLLIHLAGIGLFRARWSQQIHEEWINSLLHDRPELSRERLERTRDLMNVAVLNCLVEGYESLIPALLLPDPNDRHVLAAAVVAGVDLIVTANVRHFPKQSLRKYDVEALSPDCFIVGLIKVAPEQVCRAAREHRRSLKHPPKSAEEYLETLRRQSLPETVAALSQLRNRI
jgi:hypothetical protein